MSRGEGSGRVEMKKKGIIIGVTLVFIFIVLPQLSTIVNSTLSGTTTDTDGVTDVNQTTAVVLQANYPPSAPSITGGPGVNGHKYVSYDFEVMSTDEDNDLLQYTINWGEGNISQTGFFPSGLAVIQPHSWLIAGRYQISAVAFDNSTESATTTAAVLIDAVYVDRYGYLVDTNGDAVYDVFYSNVTGSFTAVKHQSDGTYLIEANGDGHWDYLMNPQTKQVSVYQSGTPLQSSLLILGGILVFIVILFLLIVLLTWKKKSGQIPSPVQEIESEKPREPEQMPSAVPEAEAEKPSEPEQTPPAVQEAEGEKPKTDTAPPKKSTAKKPRKPKQ
jgi:hypothetical protein